ncbi:MAG: hypothetical protein V2A73_06375, partial [Pseudomonadota bacterium]
KSINNSENSADFAWAVAVDTGGNIVVAGSIAVSGHGLDAWVRKFGPDGEVVWTYTFDGPAGSDDEALAVSIDDEGSGSVFIAGYQTTVDAGTDMIVQELDPSSGTVLWSDDWDGEGLDDRARGVDLDSHGHVIYVGTETYPKDDGTTIYRGWVMHDTRAGGGSRAGGVAGFSGVAVMVDSSDNIFEVYDTGRGLYVRKEDNATVSIWNQYTPGASGTTQGYGLHGGIVVAPDGNPVVAGSATSAEKGKDVFIRKLSSADGATVWTQQFDGGASVDDEAMAIAADADGNIAVSGYVGVAGSPQVAWIARYDSDGKQYWHNELGTTTGDCAATGVAIDSLGHVIVVVTEPTAGESHNIKLVKYSP